jgi:hypothetical protein
VTPASAPIRFQREDEEVASTFTIDAPASLSPGEWTIGATVTAASGAASNLGYQVVEYPHIHRRHVVEPAAARVKAIDVTIQPGLKAGYIMGSGDRVPEAITQLGGDVQLLDASGLASGDLSRFGVILVGVRAYERRPDLRASNERLLEYARRGGTVIVQYQRDEFNAAQYGPYPAKTSPARVTDENAPMELLVPAHAVFSTPNRIGPETWANWVQERGTYFLGERDARYVDLLRSSDPFPYNAGPKTGILVEARVGRGRWIYTGSASGASFRGRGRRVSTAGEPAQPGDTIVAIFARLRPPRPQRELRGRQAQFLAPLMAIHYAHLVMLAERGIVSAATRRDPRRARRDSTRRHPAGPVRRHLRGSLLLRRAADRGGCGRTSADGSTRRGRATTST